MEKVKVKTIIKINNKYLNIAFCFIFQAAVFYVFSKANVHVEVATPFSITLLFAFVWLNKNSLISVGAFLLSYPLSTLSLKGFYISLFAAGVALLVYFINFKLSGKINKYLISIACAISYSIYIWQNAGGTEQTVAVIISVFIGVVALFAFINFFNASVVRNFYYKLNLDECICGLIMLAVFCLGLTNVNIYGVEFIKIFACFGILFLTYFFKEHFVLVFALTCGLGAALCNLDVSYIALFACFALGSLAFKTGNKVYSLIALLLVDVVFGLYLKSYMLYTVFDILSVIIAELIFLIIPNKMCEKITSRFSEANNSIAIRHIVNRNKESICKRLDDLGNVFNEMNSAFRDMVQGMMSPDEVKDMLSTELVTKSCKNCLEKNSCLRLNGVYTSEIFNDIIDAALERGKATLLDIPQYLSTKCNRVNHILNTINQLVSNYKNYNLMVSNMDCSRLLIADQLNGICQILKNLSGEISQSISYNLNIEKNIIEDLVYKNINCLEAIVYESNTTIKRATLIIKSPNLNIGQIENVVSDCVGVKMKVEDVNPSEIAAAQIITLKTSANFDMVFGSASRSKTGVITSGDTHSLIKIEEGKYLLALCDGMGSGEKAYKNSRLTIGLIENFYKAGFDNEIILNSVNKLLGIGNNDDFSALDICVLDLRKNVCDFIKLGAPKGYIKHVAGTEMVETSGLPIGVLEEMKPHVTKKMIAAGDTYVLVSDGIVDAFKTDENLCQFINNVDTTNPQTLCDEVLDYAIDIQKGECGDDMTVVAVRTFLA